MINFNSIRKNIFKEGGICPRYSLYNSNNLSKNSCVGEDIKKEPKAL